MVFNSMGLSFGIVAGLVIWMGIISVLLIRMISHYNRLSKGVTKAGLLEVLEGMFRSIHDLGARVDRIDKQTNKLTIDGSLHVQRIGIVRFNPFADTGGAQSFSMALLDAEGNVIVMTSLYARSGNRWYVKEVVGGKGKELALSKEEESVIQKAQHIGAKTV